MLIGIALILIWLVLLQRYPTKALLVSLAAALCLGLVTLWVLWQDSQDTRQLERLELRLSYSPERCPADNPLRVQLHNGNNQPLLALQWRVAAYRPGDTVNLADDVYAAPRYRGPGELKAGGDWQDCLPIPPLRPGYRAETVEFRAEHLQGNF
ncbi:multidrug transporter [Pseudomonas sp. 10B1]|uniref:multidrug transporter n=1 Tax=unclassified Pseudomonas TaxID=196821 RepID=UPI002AB3A71C|nr:MULTISPECIES: multidrug transporter [unclassified Pseudomonas]MDY7559095.1 multidrug transporter [Pseudomonas sp. AB6]MEA9977661.1 multidrug transporter [Pseudomonas sp. RTS4]MEA9996522.1 multidrug transporter [Pseudomonas sp. AA4]MEB0086779.1 multidrug transporter [Pseudomonas sp. RTI1]MEB0124829.1 multidrug transporter [Pseudomonas sp. CCC1.2]